MTSLLTKDAQKDLTFFSEKLEVYMNPGAHTLAKALVMHFHGGGFVGQTSKSHASYVRLWASQLQDAVIISVDYKLAPEKKWVLTVFLLRSDRPFRVFFSAPYRVSHILQTISSVEPSFPCRCRSFSTRVGGDFVSEHTVLLLPPDRYPYAINECVAAYDWAIKNCSEIGEPVSYMELSLARRFVPCTERLSGRTKRLIALSSLLSLCL